MLLCLLIAALALVTPVALLWLLARVWTPAVLSRFILSGGRTQARDRAVLYVGWGLASCGTFLLLWWMVGTC